MKKNKMMRIASVLLVAVLLSTCAISGTFAKYTSNVDISGSATVAKWAFNIGETSIFEENATFELDIATDTYTNVATNTPAPGTEGSFSFELENESEVAADYTLTFTVVVKDSNDNKYEVSLKFTDAQGNVLAADSTTGKYSVTGSIDMDKTEKITVDWEWEFDAESNEDTEAALAEAEIVVTANLVVTQQDTTKSSN